jgi:hypothetical protein
MPKLFHILLLRIRLDDMSRICWSIPELLRVVLRPHTLPTNVTWQGGNVLDCLAYIRRHPCRVAGFLSLG